MKKIVLLAVAAVAAYSQPFQQVLFIAPPPPAVTSVSVSLVGSPGGASYCYFVIATFPRGNSNPSASTCIFNAPSTLTGSNYLRLNWTSVPGATTYDVVRFTSPLALPSGSCASCAVITATASTSFLDQGGATSGYTFASAGPATGSLAINNQKYAQPRLVSDLPIQVPVLAFADGTTQSTAGGGGTPAGTPGQIQTNGGGVFGAISIGSGLLNSAGSLIPDPSIVAELATINTFTNLNDFSAGQLRAQTTTGAPAGGQCNASNHVGKIAMRSDTQAANGSLYVCSQTGVGTFSWELAQPSSTGITPYKSFAAGCPPGGTPSMYWASDPSGSAASPACRGGGVNGAQGTVNFNAVTSVVWIPFLVPSNYSGQSVTLDLDFVIAVNGTYAFTVQTAFPSYSSNTDFTATTFNPAQTINVTVTGTANNGTTYSYRRVTQTGLTMTGATAGVMGYVKLIATVFPAGNVGWVSATFR